MILIGLGSNLPFCGASPQEVVSFAGRICSLFGANPAISPLYASPAWPNPADPPFVNAVLKLDHGPPPQRLMEDLHSVETAFGRVRSQPNAPRTLDLDLLDYGGQISRAGDTLVLPHPRLGDRDFVLVPIADVAPAWRHPVSGLSAGELLARLSIRQPLQALPGAARG